MVHALPVPLRPVPRRHPFRRWGWILIGVIALGIGVAWATEPARRREILFEAPMRLEAGAVVRGRFAPDHEGPYVIELRFRQAWIEALSEVPRGGDEALRRLSESVGGGWWGDAPAPWVRCLVLGSEAAPSPSQGASPGIT